MVQAIFHKFILSRQKSVLNHNTENIFKTHEQESPTREKAMNSFDIENYDFILPESDAHTVWAKLWS